MTYKDHTFVPGQGNNAYIFPGVGLGVVATRARRVPDTMFLAAAKALAKEVGSESLAQGCIYPPLKHMRETSLSVAEAVARVAYDEGLAEEPRPDDLVEHIRKQVYVPVYRNYV